MKLIFVLTNLNNDQLIGRFSCITQEGINQILSMHHITVNDIGIVIEEEEL